MRLQQFISEEITHDQLNQLEKILDGLFKKFSIDIEFTKHFFNRVNDTRNKRDITVAELQSLFRKTYARYAKEFLKYGDGMQAVLDDIQTDINIPFVLKWNSKSKMIELISKTVMRKKGFKTSNKVFKV